MGSLFGENILREVAVVAVAQEVDDPYKGSRPAQLNCHGFESQPLHEVVGKS